MSQGGDRHNIMRIRTFADDFERAKNPQDTYEETPALPVPETTLQEAVSQENNPVTFTKKNVGSEEGMIFYDKENTPIEDKPYEEQRVVLEDIKTEEVENIPVAQEVSSVTKRTKNSILTDDDQEGADILHSGTIIKDTKRKRFRLIPAMGTALKNWFVTQKEEYEESKKDPYTVEKAENRVETIKAAVRESARAPSEDYDIVAQRLKKVERKKIAETVAFKPKEELPTPQWSHIVAETDKPSVQNISATVPEQKVDWPNSAEKAAKNADSIIENAQRPPTVEKMSTSTLSQTNQTPQEPAAPIQTRLPQSTPPPAPRTSSLVTQPKTISSTSSNAFPLRLFVGVVMIATILGIAVSMYFFAPKNETKKTPVVHVPSLVATQTQIPVSFTSDHVTLFETIMQTIAQSTNDITQVYVTNGEEVTDTQTLIRTLAPTTPGSFSRTIKEITFGGASHEPFIVLRATSFDTAFAGMLQWENTMSADLAPLFGSPVIESFDPHARTDTQVRSAFFKDIVVANHSARLLVDELGTERILYVFIDQNTIVITTTKETFEILAPRIR